jgi:hypothetical protein
MVVHSMSSEKNKVKSQRIVILWLNGMHVPTEAESAARDFVGLRDNAECAGVTPESSCRSATILG